MRTKAKKAPMCSVSLIAEELEGLAAPGEALKNVSAESFCVDIQEDHWTTQNVM